jgi:ABC-2 type transport system ATP-binding protein
MSDYAIEINNLSKIYKASGKSPEKRALKNIELKILKGSIFGLLGPNGAGKSTLINIMAGLVTKSEGTVKIWDYDIDQFPRAVKNSIGVVPQEINYDPFFTPLALLNIQAGLYGVPKNERHAMDLLKIVGLEDKAQAYARSLSGGMLRRLMVAKAMVHTPPILVLDEPTAGVDVELRRALWDNVRELNRRGTTIVLTTHYLEEAEELCDQIAIINRGQIIVSDETENLLGRVDQKEITFRLDRPLNEIPSALLPFNPVLEAKRSIKCRYAPQDNVVGMMIEALQKSGVGIVDIATEESDLEDVFLQLIRSDITRDKKI